MSERSAAIEGSSRNAYTGMKIAKMPYCCRADEHVLRRHASGRTTGTAAGDRRARLGVSVMNSRSAKNDASANSTSVIVAPGEERHGENADHHPPGVDALVEIGDGSRPSSRRPAGATSSAADDRSDAQQHHERAEQPEEFRRQSSSRCSIMRPPSAPPARSPPHARAREKSPCFSPPATRRGAPKRTVHTTGTGSSAPLGRLRCRLSRYTGTSSTPGNSPPSRNRPLRNGAGSAPVPRVPSGKMISESPSRSAARSGSSGSASAFSRARSIRTAPKPRVAMYFRGPLPQ